jgi:hypothetical protein
MEMSRCARAYPRECISGRQERQRAQAGWHQKIDPSVHCDTQTDQLEARLGEDPERSRPALIEAIGDRIVLQPDVSGRFLWAEYGLAGERLVASLGVPEIMVAGAGFDTYLMRIPRRNPS